MCEALNGTFKRDYVFESCLDDPKTVHSQIQGWVDDYNNFAPHSDLKMKTPKEYFIFKDDICVHRYLIVCSGNIAEKLGYFPI